MLRRSRPTARALACATLLGLVVLLVAAPPRPAAAAGRPFLGINLELQILGTGPLLSREARMIGRRGVRLARASVYWDLVQPYARPQDVPPEDRAKYVLEDGVPTNWSDLDPVVAALARNGITLMPSILRAPPWARRDPSLLFSPPADAAAYGRFVGQMARRYGSRGTFWSAHPQLPRRPIVSWQIWNEPLGGDVDSASVYWADPVPKPYVDYVAMLRASRAAVKAADPHGRIVFAGLFGHVWQTLKPFYDAGARGLFDEVSVNPYAITATNAVRIVEYTRRWLNRNGGRRIPINVSELCWASDLGGRFSGPQDVLPEGVRTGKLKLATLLFSRQRKRLGVRSIYWFTWVTTFTSKTDQFDYCGARRIDGNGRVRSTRKIDLLGPLARATQR